MEKGLFRILRKGPNVSLRLFTKLIIAWKTEIVNRKKFKKNLRAK